MSVLSLHSFPRGPVGRGLPPPLGAAGRNPSFNGTDLSMSSLSHLHKLNLGATMKHPTLPLLRSSPSPLVTSFQMHWPALLLCNQAKYGPASGPLHLLFPLPRLCFPQMFSGFTPSLVPDFCSVDVLSEDRSKHSVNKPIPPHSPDTPQFL